MTAAEIERLAVVEMQIDNICERLGSMEVKLDAVLNTKADKTALALVEERQQHKADKDDVMRKADADDVIRKADKVELDALAKNIASMQQLVYGLLVSSVMLLVTTLIGIAVFVLQGHIHF